MYIFDSQLFPFKSFKWLKQFCLIFRSLAHDFVRWILKTFLNNNIFSIALKKIIIINNLPLSFVIVYP